MDLFNLKAILKLDDSDYKSGLSSAASLAGKAGGAIGNGLATAAKIGTAALTATTAAVTAVGTAAIKSYANYEQLAGGVEKLYGTAADKIKEYADQAYKTSGMSANQYMETATSFSAALIKSLDGDVNKAADLTDVAMRAISDNVNVFGSDMQSVQSAFQGFAKENYTMLDNLKLGYGGTKEGMEQLIADANEYRASIGQSADLTIDSFADIVQAVQSVQEAQNIAGTTNKEAMTTIEGSANATKAAWQNVITAIGRGEGLTEAFDGLISAVFGNESGGGLLNNIIPRIQTVMEGVGQFVATAGPYISEKLPELVNSVVPTLINAGMNLLSALGQGFMDYLPSLLFTVGDIVETVLQALVDATSNGGGFILEVIDWIIGVFEENYMDFIDMGFEIITNILEGFTSGETDILYYAREVIEHFGKVLVEYAPTLIQAAGNMILTLATSIGESLPTLIPVAVDVILTIVQGLIDNIGLLVEGAIQLAVGLANGLIEALPIIIEKLPELVMGIVNALIENLPLLLQAVIQITIALAQAIIENLPAFINAVVQIITQIGSMIAQKGAELISQVGQIITNLMNNLQAWLSQLPTKMAYYAGRAIGEFIKFFLQLPSKIIGIFNNVMSSVSNFGSNMITRAREAADGFKNNLISGLMELPGKLIEVGHNVVEGLWNGISSGWNGLIDKVKSLADNLVQGIKDSLRIESPSKVFRWIGEMIDAGLALGIDTNLDAVKDAVDSLTSAVDLPIDDVNFGSTSLSTTTGSGMVQYLTINSPRELNPSEIARQTRNANREMMLRLRTT